VVLDQRSCGRAGTGRRRTLKKSRSSEHVGSIPAARTTSDRQAAARSCGLSHIRAGLARIWLNPGLPRVSRRLAPIIGPTPRTWIPTVQPACAAAFRLKIGPIGTVETRPARCAHKFAQLLLATSRGRPRRPLFAHLAMRRATPRLFTLGGSYVMLSSVSAAVATAHPELALTVTVVVQPRMWARADSIHALDQLYEHAPRVGDVPGLLRCECWNPEHPELHPHSLITVWTDLEAYTAWRSWATRGLVHVANVAPPVVDMLVNPAEVEIGTVVHRESAR
jgi:heme-degrading monooxygenase HmoA